MKKSIHISLVPDENKEFKAEMFKDDNLVKEEKITADEFKNYMNSKIDEQSLKIAREAIKLFKVKNIKIHIKE